MAPQALARGVRPPAGPPAARGPLEAPAVLPTQRGSPHRSSITVYGIHLFLVEGVLRGFLARAITVAEDEEIRHDGSWGESMCDKPRRASLSITAS
jgi:hypothetical protein